MNTCLSVSFSVSIFPSLFSQLSNNLIKLFCFTIFAFFFLWWNACPEARTEFAFLKRVISLPTWAHGSPRTQAVGASSSTIQTEKNWRAICWLIHGACVKAPCRFYQSWPLLSIFLGEQGRWIESAVFSGATSSAPHFISKIWKQFLDGLTQTITVTVKLLSFLKPCKI